MNLKAELYNSKNIDEMEWPDTSEGQYAKEFLVPLVKNKISYYIDNIDADIYVLKLKDIIFPVLVATENYANSWVCSPYAHYIIYGQEFSGLIGNPFLSSLAKGFLHSLGKLCRYGKINSIVYVNNWLFSTDLYPQGLTLKDIEAILAVLTRQFPQHAIIWRSLNRMTTPDLLKLLEKSHFHFIASRYVYITDTLKEAIFKTRIIKSDLKLWNETSYKIVDEHELQLNDCEELLNLHQQLYIFQHSTWQPQYNLEYMKLLFDKKLLKFKVLISQGQIKGVAGYYQRGNIMMCPIFGYQKECPDSSPIYRLLNTALLLEAQKAGLIFHQSAGASFFKSIRRAEGCLEYLAVYTQHLPFHRQWLWSTLQCFINKVGSRYMQKY